MGLGIGRSKIKHVRLAEEEKCIARNPCNPAESVRYILAFRVVDDWINYLTDLKFSSSFYLEMLHGARIRVFLWAIIEKIHKAQFVMDKASRKECGRVLLEPTPLDEPRLAIKHAG